MRTMDEIFDQAVLQKGDEGFVRGWLAAVKSPDEIAAIPDDRILAGMTRAIFQAGFSWKVIDRKWDGFEDAFEGFNPVRWKYMSDDDLDALVSDTRIVRNGQKIITVRDNAIMICDLAEKYDSTAACIGHWPNENYIGLLDMLKKNGSRLGGASCQYFLRFLGRDSWIMSRDVIAALIREGVIDKAPTSKKAQAQVQAAFNQWSSDSGMSLTHISQLLALSVG